MKSGEKAEVHYTEQPIVSFANFGFVQFFLKYLHMETG